MIPALLVLNPQNDFFAADNPKRSHFLTTILHEAYRHLRQQVAGLTAEEFFWEPADECWTVRRLKDGRWSLDYEETPADPAPVPTIAWRVVHVAACKTMYYEYAFGPGRLTWDDLSLPGTVDRALTWLEEEQQRLTSALDELTDSELETLRPTNWGEQWPTWRLFWTLAAHDLEHGAEIGLLRQIYRSSAGENGVRDE